MRHRQVPAVAVLVGLGALNLAGCGNRPNDLETYYDDPSPSPETSAPVQPPAPAPVSVPPSPSRAAVDPRPALLSDEDVAEEGVTPGAGQASGCLSGLAAGERRSASWRYPSGSVLTHEVTAYADRRGADVVSAADCAGEVVALPTAPGVAEQRVWCADATCSVLLANGNVVSALSVAASTPERAQDAAKRLLPKLAAKLAAVQP
ncbi:hypothetical protein [Amycolatopsis jiangsuensis]|uniref:DUF3558 domain-containing protein n=1 Tax=Amycolatopsis jiangsuensis TaxID=1181879 RepID=A0A840IP00_9PSEU|nr:hypothetical protein [Amycolatopsis jiangsuensis]MBB4683613.1 hypothetical protein [Amycolatopsis jiangsuensis]